MRVVAGAFKGHRLSVPPGRGVRPTADRVREALFSILGPVEGLRVLDLFAGSGALGIEALSRGAADAVFVDRDARSVVTVRRNLGAVGAEARVHRREALSFLAAEARSGKRFDLVFVDPPYSSARRLAEPLSERLPTVTGESARIVTESDRRNPLALTLPLADERTYGDTRVAIHHGAS
jgi:16S rRNA (guanine966-N2)-methyltransferase